ncbi:MAG: hypothetical protein V2A63_02215 [Patescibacteria group bacterium]
MDLNLDVLAKKAKKGKPYEFDLKGGSYRVTIIKLGEDYTPTKKEKAMTRESRAEFKAGRTTNLKDLKSELAC